MTGARLTVADEKLYLSAVAALYTYDVNKFKQVVKRKTIH